MNLITLNKIFRRFIDNFKEDGFQVNNLDNLIELFKAVSTLPGLPKSNQSPQNQYYFLMTIANRSIINY